MEKAGGMRSTRSRDIKATISGKTVAHIQSKNSRSFVLCSEAHNNTKRMCTTRAKERRDKRQPLKRKTEETERGDDAER